ncbi:MAG TPA: lectin [Thermomonas sp.]|nr:lectin [Thermomonas sp.]
MRTLLSMTLLAAFATLAGCGDRTTPAASPEAKIPPAAAPIEAAATPATPGDAPAPPKGNTGGSLRVDAPAEGTITFKGFGPANFGATAEEVRMAWGGDLGDARPSEPGGCYYLIPQPVGADGYRTAFMIEGDKFARIDVRRDDVAAPGGGKVGMTRAQVAALYTRIEEQPHKYTHGQYLRVKDAAGGNGVLVFEADGKGDDARVTAWRIGVPPQVDYVEGCS